MPEFEEVVGSGSIWKPKKAGDNVQGTVLKKENRKYGLTLDLQTAEGIIATPAHVVLQSILDNVEVGDTIRIKYLGKKKGKRYGQYKVERKRGK